MRDLKRFRIIDPEHVEGGAFVEETSYDRAAKTYAEDHYEGEDEMEFQVLDPKGLVFDVTIDVEVEYHFDVFSSNRRKATDEEMALLKERTGTEEES